MSFPWIHKFLRIWHSSATWSQNFNILFPFLHPIILGIPQRTHSPDSFAVGLCMWNTRIICRGYEQQGTYGETFFYTIYRISFSHSYHIEKSTVQVYISPSLFITENENTKQTCEWSYETRNTKRTEVSISLARVVIA
jgi:hypothetical protein